MRHVFLTMGTAVSIELPGIDSAGRALESVEQIFGDADRRFSLYRADSELSRIASGTLALLESSPELRGTYAEALLWRNETGGAFTPHRPDGIIDLNGIVKAQTIERAGSALDDAGLTHWSINAGGDILCRGSQSAEAPWTLGIADPADRLVLLCSVALAGDRRAIATSGSAERGDHIWRKGSLEQTEFVQATVVANSIVTADVLATAIVSGGGTSLDQFTARWSIDALTVDRAGNLRATPGLRSALATPRASPLLA
jgi:thiamine biosynthesis lipoprotein